MSENLKPLAARIRPRTIANFCGQTHLLGQGKALKTAIDTKNFHSMIFWGPPGTGKTTLVNLIASAWNCHLLSLSAVLGGVKEVREAVKEARLIFSEKQTRSILFIDEIHRFNKSQQDALLPYVEDGTVTLIGATTENPSFALNNALLSRARVYVFQAHDHNSIKTMVEQALTDSEFGYGQLNLNIPPEKMENLVQVADGDGRRALNLLEMLVDFAVLKDGIRIIPEQAYEEVLTGTLSRFDNKSDIFYEQISALHKSIRGSDPDAACYWLARMLDAGCDPLYLARRIVRIASEDIGNADPRGLTLALDAWQVQERVGSPEGELALAQAVIYLSSCAKSNAVYTAFNEAILDAKTSGSLEVPAHLRNAPTKLMKEIGYGKNYRYAHNEENAFAKGECYMPKELKGRRYYYPVERGLEIKIKEKLDKLRELNN